MGLIAKLNEIKEQLDSSSGSSNRGEGSSRRGDESSGDDESLGLAPSRQEPNQSDPTIHH